MHKSGQILKNTTHKSGRILKNTTHKSGQILKSIPINPEKFSENHTHKSGTSEMLRNK